nr:immunoglobulin heavy chain junction region [Mus musculus]
CTTVNYYGSSYRYFDVW